SALSRAFYLPLHRRLAMHATDHFHLLLLATLATIGISGELAGKSQPIDASFVTSVSRSLGLPITVLVLTLMAIAISAGGSMLLARRLRAPLRRLTASAERIGNGDLATPIKPERGQDIGTLADTLEDMRACLQEATVELRRQRAEAHAILGGIE